MAMFGSNCCNDNLDSLIVASDICNRLGMDTISAGACVAFAIECFENGLITTEDTGGLEMKWGDHRAIVALTEMLGEARGLRRRPRRRRQDRRGEDRQGLRAVRHAHRRPGDRGPRPAGRLGLRHRLRRRPHSRPAQPRRRAAPAGPRHPEVDRDSARGPRGSTTRPAPTTCTPSAPWACASSSSARTRTPTSWWRRSRPSRAGRTSPREELLKTGERITNVRQAFNHARRPQGSVQVSRQDAGRAAQGGRVLAPASPSPTRRSTTSTSS